MVIAAAVAVGLLLFGGTGAAIGWSLSRAHVLRPVGQAQSQVQTGSQQVSSSAQSSQRLDLQAIASKVDPAVVDIDTVISVGGRSGRAAGTGMIVTPSGAVLTNYHVIEGARTITVSIGGRSDGHRATVVGVDPSGDIAVIQIQGVSDLPTVTLADSSTLTVGQDVVAIGNALGQGGTPTATEGTITGLNRSISVSGDFGRTEQLSGLIESDASISPGDSGGPLVNRAGQVVGMITAGTSEGFRQTTSTDGYAIPSSSTADVVNQILSGQGSSTVIIGQPGYLGVRVTDLDAATASSLNLGGSSGVLVTGVTSGSPAVQAGIARGSVITAINGTAVGSPDALGSAIQSHKPGERITVAWVDRSGSHTATVALASGP